MRVVGALDHDSAEFDRDILLSQGAGQAELEDARGGIAEPVILDQILGDDVSRQYRRTLIPVCPCNSGSSRESEADRRPASKAS